MKAGQHRQHRAVHGHRDRHLVERDAVEQDLHVLDGVDRDAGLADVAHRRADGRCHSRDGWRDRRRPTGPSARASGSRGRRRWTLPAVEKPAYCRMVQGRLAYMVGARPAGVGREAGQVARASPGPRGRLRCRAASRAGLPASASPGWTRRRPSAPWPRASPNRQAAASARPPSAAPISRFPRCNRRDDIRASGEKSRKPDSTLRPDSEGFVAHTWCSP